MGNKKITNSYLIILIFFSISFSSLQISYAADNLTRGGLINDFQTLVSPGGIFNLGFFSPRNSRNRYVGIWYLVVANPYVVWVANRENPISDSSGTLHFTSDGNLTILQGDQTVITLYSQNSPSNTTLKLLDSGNLVVIEGNSDTQEGVILWQSFDHPTDTLLPSMKLGFDFRTRTNMSLTSPVSEQVLAPGAFTLGLDPNRTNQLVIWERGEVYWRSGVWNGHNFSLLPFTVLYSFNISFVSNEDEHYFTYTLNGGSWSNQRWVMDLRGLIMTDDGPSRGQDPLGRCDGTSSDWDGCVQRGSRPNCTGRDVFSTTTTSVQFDAPYEMLDLGLALTDCENFCRRNCSCTAYSSADTNGSGCSFWFGELGRTPFISAHDVFERITTTNSGGRNRPLALIIGLTIASIVLVMSFITCFLWRKKVKRKGEKEKSDEHILLDMSGSRINDDEPGEGGKKGPDLRVFSFAFISTVTDNFSSANKLGQGGFGPVYKGKLPSGKEIAVKRLSRTSGQGLEEFKNEIILIAKLQHMNLVRLFGCCIQGEEKLLIYEYMPNKSLDFYLFDPTKGGLLDWRKRINIIEGIAQGLLYLHKYSRLKIIHRDMKASNILLDGEMNPKISDFGMARIFGRNETEANTGRIVGTYGYMSPEYAMEGLFSEKSDVFSFGVLLLEIVTGKRSTSLYHSQDSLNLIGYAWELWKEDKAMALVDPILGDSSSLLELLRYIHIALLCVQERATNRPTMSDVVSMLSNGSVTLPNPKQPAFLITRSLPEGDSHTIQATNISINDVTISTIKGR